MKIDAIEAALNTTIGDAKISLQNKIDTSKAAIETELNASKVALQTEIDALETKVDVLIASLQTSSTGSAVGGGEGAASGRRTRQLQSDDTDEETDLGPVIGSSLGLTIDIRCPPPRNTKTKKSKGAQTLTIDVLVNMQSFGKDCNATVSSATAIYVNKEGDYKTQVGRIKSSIPMVEGVQIVSIDLDKEKDEINENKDVTTLHITAIKEGGTHQKSGIFDYDCQAY